MLTSGLFSILWTLYGEFFFLESGYNYQNSFEFKNVIKLFSFIETIFLIPLVFNFAVLVVAKGLSALIAFTLLYFWIRVNGGNPERHP